MKSAFFTISKLILLIAAVQLAGCQTMKKIYDPERGLFQSDDATLYENAHTALKNGGYANAARYYEMLETKYPFSDKLPQAYLDIIYAYYASGDSASAATSADRYTHMYPRSPHVDYAYYMKALANYDHTGSWTGKYLALDSSMRDLGPLHESYDSFAYLIKRFPASPYVPDARKRMIFLRNLFAEHEVKVAQFYMSRHAYLAAANRASYVLEHYQQAPQSRAALRILEEANQHLGLTQTSQQAKQLLEANP